MPQDTSVQAEVNALSVEYEAYVRGLRMTWLAKNRPQVDPRDVYEVMRLEDKAKVHRCIDQWKEYITPIAETWWKERGYGVIWPDDDSKPMQVYKLEAAEP